MPADPASAQTNLSEEAKQILKGLSEHGSLLVSGPPGCGKSYVMQEVADAFQKMGQSAGRARLQQTGFVAIPRGDGSNPNPTAPDLSHDRTDRHVGRITFSPSTKPHQFIAGLRPKPEGGFQVVKGVLVTSNEAALNGGASLVIIDELSRGPAIQLFSDALVAMEKDRRLLPDGSRSAQSFPMLVMDDTGVEKEFFLSSHLYILAAMNHADRNVDGLDVAFLRRWARLDLAPRPDIARSLLNAAGLDAVLPAADPSPGELMEALIRAWSHVNDQVRLGESADLQLGHGIMLANRDRAGSIKGAQAIALDAWKRISSHVKEVFYSNVINQSIALRATNGGGPGYSVRDVAFGQSHKQVLHEPELRVDNIYAVLRQIGG